MPLYEVTFRREYSVLIDAENADQADRTAESIEVLEADWTDLDCTEAEQLNDTDEEYYRRSGREIIRSANAGAASPIEQTGPELPVHSNPDDVDSMMLHYSRRHIEAGIDIAIIGTAMGVTCADSRRLVNVYSDMAINFEATFDAENGDYMSEIENFTQSTLLRNATSYNLCMPKMEEGPGSAYLYGLVLDLIKAIDSFGPVGGDPSEFALNGPKVKAIDIMTRLYGRRFTEDCHRFGIAALGGMKVTMVKWIEDILADLPQYGIEFFSSRAKAIQWFENMRLWSSSNLSEPEITEHDVDVAL